MPGGELLRRWTGAGLPVQWYLTGIGIPPKPTDDEIREHVKHLKRDLDYWTSYLRDLDAAREEVRRLYIENKPEKSYRNAAEPKQSYTSKRGKKK